MASNLEFSMITAILSIMILLILGEAGQARLALASCSKKFCTTLNHKALRTDTSMQLPQLLQNG